MELIDQDMFMYEMVWLVSVDNELSKRGSTGQMLPDPYRICTGTHEARIYMLKLFQAHFFILSSHTLCVNGCISIIFSLLVALCCNSPYSKKDKFKLI